jgi:hypothetical protein
VVEAATVCLAQTSTAGLEAGLPALLLEARQIGRELGQDAVAVAVDGVLVIISPAPAVPASGARPLPDSALAQARALVAPVPTAQKGGEFEHADFWEAHANVLTRAWHELGLRNTSLASLQPGFVEPRLAAAVAAARADPTPATEAAVRSLWTLAAPGVYSLQLLAPELIAGLQQELRHGP